MNLNRILSIADLERQAQRKLPRSIFTHIAAGSEDEASVRLNRNEFDFWSLAPRSLIDVSARSQASSIFDQATSAPFGIAPMGVAAVCCFEADLALARAAQRENIPMILSAASTVPLEKVMEAAPNLWYQAYVPANRKVCRALFERLRRAGVSRLVITVDCAVSSNRERPTRDGFVNPPRLTPGLILDGLSRPSWLAGTLGKTLLNGGIPRFTNFTAEGAGPITAGIPAGEPPSRNALSWDHLAWIREQWPSILIVKGLLRVEDVRRAEAIGLDGVILSNHGGRQLDHAIAPLRILPAVVAATRSIEVMIDSGFRRGTDIVKALALGAKFVFVGRPLMYGVAVGGEQGAQRAIAILKRELDITLGLCGCPQLADVGPDLVEPVQFATPKNSASYYPEVSPA